MTTEEIRKLKKNNSGDLTSKQCEFQKENAKIQKKEKLLKKEYKKTLQTKEYIFPVYKGLSRVEHNGFKKKNY